MSTTAPNPDSDPDHTYESSDCHNCDLEIIPLFDYENAEWYCPVCAATIPATDVVFDEWMDFPPSFDLGGELYSTR